MRICVKPDDFTRARGVVIRRINSFSFRNEDVVQYAIAPNGRESRDAIVNCIAGDALCALRTKLRDDLFRKGSDEWENITAVGEVYLEFEADPAYLNTDTVGGTRHLRRQSRRLANADDTLFAGKFLVEFSFNITNAEIEEEKDATPRSQILGITLACVTLIIALSLLWCYRRRMNKENLDDERYVDGCFPRDVDINSKASFFDHFNKDLESTESEEYLASSNVDSSDDDDEGDTEHILDEDDDDFLDEIESEESNIDTVEDDYADEVSLEHGSSGKDDRPPRTIGVRKGKKKGRRSNKEKPCSSSTDTPTDSTHTTGSQNTEPSSESDVKKPETLSNKSGKKKVTEIESTMAEKQTKEKLVIKKTKDKAFEIAKKTKAPVQEEIESIEEEPAPKNNTKGATKARVREEIESIEDEPEPPKQNGIKKTKGRANLATKARVREEIESIEEEPEPEPPKKNGIKKTKGIAKLATKARVREEIELIEDEPEPSKKNGIKKTKGIASLATKTRVREEIELIEDEPEPPKNNGIKNTKGIANLAIIEEIESIKEEPEPLSENEGSSIISFESKTPPPKSTASAPQEDNELAGESSIFKPKSSDVCFGSPFHHGTLVYELAVRNTVFGEPWSPLIYGVIKKQLEGRKYYILDGSEWREATTLETIFQFGKYYSEQTNRCSFVRRPSKIYGPRA
jgi:hypothetical protein